MEKEKGSLLIEYMSLQDLIPYAANARKHGKSNIKEIAGSILEYGFNDPIAINEKDSVIIEGHGRLLAAKDLDLKSVPVIKLGHLSPAQIKGYTLIHNRLAEKSEWDKEILTMELDRLQELDFDISLAGFDEQSLDDLDIDLDLADPQFDDESQDEIPVTSENEFGVKVGDIWLLGEHRLMCGDCTEKDQVDLLMDGNRAAFCFTSPPYSDQRDYRGDLELCPDHLAKFLGAPCDLFAVNLGMKRKDHEVVPYWDEYISVSKRYGHKLLSWNVWDKLESGSVGNQTAMFAIEHEWIFIFGKNASKISKTVETKFGGSVSKSNSIREKDGTTRKVPDYEIAKMKTMGTVTRVVPFKARNHDIKHPAMFPVELPEEYIKACSNESDIILEPFAGSGSTLIACEKTKRKCYGMEIDPHYCSIIIKRWQEFTGKEAIQWENQDRKAQEKAL